MDNFCRGCLIKYEESSELLQYSEKNRRLFVYSTGLQVKRTDTFSFQLCKECSHNMKIACNFKKACRNSEKKLKNYLALKEAGENLDFTNYLKHNDDTLKLRFPVNIGNSTPAASRNKDDDNESTCTSIQNFMTDIFRPEEIPDSEARIIKEVIEEEADVLEDSLDSHWLQDDASIDTDFRLDFSFSPFSTPRTENNETFYIPKKEEDDDPPYPTYDPTVEIVNKNSLESAIVMENIVDYNQESEEENKCSIDINLENALKNDSAQKIMLDELLATPPVNPNISVPSTPVINNILFGERLEIETINEAQDQNYGVKTEGLDDDIDIIDEFLNINGIKDDEHATEPSNVLSDKMEVEETKKLDKNSNKVDKKGVTTVTDKKLVKKKFCVSKFYCKICDRKFTCLVALKVHCTKQHKIRILKPKPERIQKCMICDYCGKIFRTRNTIIKHIQNHQNPTIHRCEQCHLTFQSESTLKLHNKTHVLGKESLNNKSKSYMCNICGVACSSSSNYNIHMRRHLNKYSLSCEECGKGFYRTSDLEVHMRRHTGERPYECPLCPRRFARHDTLNRHNIKCHTGVKPYRCDYCEATFVKSYELKNHQSKTKKCLLAQQKKMTKKEEVDTNEIYYIIENPIVNKTKLIVFQNQIAQEQT